MDQTWWQQLTASKELYPVYVAIGIEVNVDGGIPQLDITEPCPLREALFPSIFQQDIGSIGLGVKGNFNSHGIHGHPVQR